MSKPPPARPSNDAPQLNVEVIVEDERWRRLGDVEQWVEDAADALRSARPDLVERTSTATILLADDAHVTQLNGTFRSKPAPTNVLSFPAGDAGTLDDDVHYLGDIVLARETVESEAQEFDIPAVHHVQHLTLHGLLHLLGFDHISDDEATAMEGIETTVLAALGIPDPYAPDVFEPVSK